jgi:hypothetical protein
VLSIVSYGVFITVLENVREMGRVFTFAPGMDLPAHQKCRAQPDLPITDPQLFGVGRALPADSSVFSDGTIEYYYISPVGMAQVFSVLGLPVR